ncbi:protein-arginine deiminase family protein [Krasilnikovia sp. MM14-A1259]|uniref:protein-arginine deiminase family protein n=1 Tax=Krasilnikovia sp. MM14-A1259 TaxID=3373539 RepID=UPI0037F7EB71
MPRQFTSCARAGKPSASRGFERSRRWARREGAAPSASRHLLTCANSCRYQPRRPRRLTELDHRPTAQDGSPVVNGRNILADAVSAAYLKADMRVTFVDGSMFESDEIHCGANVLRDAISPWRPDP